MNPQMPTYTALPPQIEAEARQSLELLLNLVAPGKKPALLEEGLQKLEFKKSEESHYEREKNIIAISTESFGDGNGYFEEAAHLIRSYTNPEPYEKGEMQNAPVEEFFGFLGRHMGKALVEGTPLAHLAPKLPVLDDVIKEEFSALDRVIAEFDKTTNAIYYLIDLKNIGSLGKETAKLIDGTQTSLQEAKEKIDTYIETLQTHTDFEKIVDEYAKLLTDYKELLVDYHCVKEADLLNTPEANNIFMAITKLNMFFAQDSVENNHHYNQLFLSKAGTAMQASFAVMIGFAHLKGYLGANDYVNENPDFMQKVKELFYEKRENVMPLLEGTSFKKIEKEFNRYKDHDFL